MNIKFFKDLHFSSTMTKWKELDSNLRNSETVIIFKAKILKFIRTTASSILVVITL